MVERIKLTVTLNKDLHDKIVARSEYPMWRNNRSYFVETVLYDYFENEGVVDDGCKERESVEQSEN